ncbi:MAG: uridine kinase [Chloroflexi bacterium]|nr:uridine kinase [Chloroflexota bacterium]
MSRAAKLVVAIAGPSGAGKSVVADAVVSVLGGVAGLLRHDWYYRDLSALPPAARHASNFDRPEALEGELLAEHLRMLRSGRSVIAPTYDFVRHVRLPQTRFIAPRTVLLIDGLFVLADPHVRAETDFGVYVDAPEEVRLSRRIARDIAERGWTEPQVRHDWEQTIRPAEVAIIEPSAGWAHLVLMNGGELAPVVQTLSKAILARLGV